MSEFSELVNKGNNLSASTTLSEQLWAKDAFPSGTITKITDFSQTSDNLPWHYTLADALKAVQGTGKQILMYVSQDYCTPCEQFENALKSDPSFGKKLEDQFVLLKEGQHSSDAPMINKQFHTWGTPAFIVVNPDGNEYKRFYGYENPSLFWRNICVATATGIRLCF